MFAVIESGHKDACILPDVYHIYKGGSDFAGMAAIAGSKIHCFHVNDYPADPPRDTISDKDRVYPGELFNPGYWKQDPEQVVTTGLAKTKEAVAKAFS